MSMFRNLLMSASKRLPNEYTGLEWIENTGSAKIITNINPTADTKFKIGFMYSRPGGGVFLGNNKINDEIRFFSANRKWYLDYYNETGTNRVEGGTIDTTKWNNFEIGNHYIKNLDTGTDIIRGQEVSSWTSTGEKIQIWGYSTDLGKVKYLKIYQNNVLVADFIPCFRKSDTITGFYDLVSDNFYSNSGSDELLKGPAVNYNNTLLLLHGDSFTDASAYGITLANRNVTIENDGKFEKCLVFNGNASLSLSNQDYFRFGTNDFTIDFWMKPIVAWTSQPDSCGIIGQKLYDNTNGWVLYRDGNYLTSINARLTSSNNFPSNSEPIIDTWEHWAFVRKNGVCKWYKNGILDATITNTANINDKVGKFYIGYSETWRGYLKAKLCEIRISDIARWDSNFTPPTEPYIN